MSVESKKAGWRRAPLNLGPRAGSKGPMTVPSRSIRGIDLHCWAMRSGRIGSAQMERPPRAGTQGLRPTRRLQPRVLARVRREGVGDWLVDPERQHVRGTEAALGQLGATLHFLVPGARAGAACPLRPESVLSVTATASSFPEDSGSRAGTRGLGSHGGLALPSSGGELTPQSTSVESPERRHLGAASLTAPGCPPCVRWWWEGWLLSRPSCLYGSQGTQPVPPASPGQ